MRIGTGIRRALAPRDPPGRPLRLGACAPSAAWPSASPSARPRAARAPSSGAWRTATAERRRERGPQRAIDPSQPHALSTLCGAPASWEDRRTDDRARRCATGTGARRARGRGARRRTRRRPRIGPAGLVRAVGPRLPRPLRERAAGRRRQPVRRPHGHARPHRPAGARTRAPWRSPPGSSRSTPSSQKLEEVLARLARGEITAAEAEAEMAAAGESAAAAGKAPRRPARAPRARRARAPRSRASSAHWPTSPRAGPRWSASSAPT